MQIDGFSLDAQKARMKAFADYNGYEIAHEYKDAGKSGKSIEGRLEFNRMIEYQLNARGKNPPHTNKKISQNFGKWADFWSMIREKQQHQAVLRLGVLFFLYPALRSLLPGYAKGISGALRV